MSQPQTPGRLTTKQLETYHQEGFIVYDKPIFPENKFEGLKNHFESKLAALPADERPEAMDTPHFIDPALFEWIFSDEILDLVEPILGPDISLFSTHFICKPRGNGKRVPWHEDGYYWKGMLDPMEVATVWLAVDPSILENGCMYAVPKSHRDAKMKRRTEGLPYHDISLDTNVFPEEIKKEAFTEDDAVPCILHPNHASLHDAYTIHGSAPNTSERRRCGYTMRFMKSATRLNPEMFNVHNIYLARGKDPGVNKLSDPSRSYAEIFNQRKSGKSVH